MDKFPSDLLNEIRIHLEAEKTDLAKRIRELSAQDPFTDPDRSNDNAASDGEASEESNHDRVAALIEELETKISAIDEALIRISDGKYGFCTNCGQMIDTDRLNILPTAILCLSCEQKKVSSKK
jgi:RNA polymerase-binding transcription factor DksA